MDIVQDWKTRARALSNAAWNAVMEAQKGDPMVEPSSAAGLALQMAEHLGKAGEEIDRLRSLTAEMAAVLEKIANGREVRMHDGTTEVVDVEDAAEIARSLDA